MKMGCCFSCKEDDEAQGGDSSETAHLLRNPVSNSTPVVRVPQSDSAHLGSVQEGIASRGQEDELAKILQETASAMIDVSGSGSHSLDQREFQERSRQYLQKVQTLSPSLIKAPNLLLEDVPNPEKQVGANLISKEDLDFMENSMDQVEKSINSINVEHSEDLVVPFGAGAE